MKRSIKLAGMLFALVTTVAAVPAANAIPQPLLTTGEGPLVQMVAPEFWQETFGGAAYIGQPLANVTVSSPVTIGGFGVWGRADFASASSPVNVMWVLFAAGDPIGAYSLQQTVTSSGERWFDSPGVSLNLAAGSYQMGLVANDTFSWGLSSPGSEIGPVSGLTIHNTMGTAVVTLAGTPGSGFDGIEAIDVNSPYPDFQPSLRIYGADYASLPPAIPEPSEWAMLLAGLMVIGFVANRRRKVTTI
jgi:hypothetical protein